MCWSFTYSDGGMIPPSDRDVQPPFDLSYLCMALFVVLSQGLFHMQVPFQCIVDQSTRFRRLITLTWTQRMDCYTKA